MFKNIMTKIKEKLFLEIIKNIKFGQMKLTLPDKKQYIFNGTFKGPHADLTILNSNAIAKMLSDGKMGFCEAYIEGFLSSTSLSNLIHLSVLNNSYIEKNLSLHTVNNIIRKYNHWKRQNSLSNSIKNISYHYDLGNNFYSKWLDDSMTYSSAVFEKNTDDLFIAQRNKYKKIAELADIQPKDSVLEIGCGWGGFLEFVALEKKAKIKGITISREQYNYAKNRIKKLNLQHLVSIEFLDYRQLNGKFDKIISIEMFEAVGEKYWKLFFEIISNSLNKGGKSALQMITIDSKEFRSYRENPDFIQKYIFPGGMLPSMQVIEKVMDTHGLNIISHKGYAMDYALTLNYWKERFTKAWPNLIKSYEFDESFRRMWELYLSYCEGGFKGGMIDVKQILIEHK